MIFSYGGNPGVGSLHRMRDAVENGWPRAARAGRALHAGMANATSRAPRACRSGSCAATPAPTSPTTTTAVAFDRVPVHRRAPDRGARGQPRRRGHPRPAGRPRRATYAVGPRRASRRRPCWPPSASIVTVEEVVDELEPRPHSVVLPNWVIDGRVRRARRLGPSYAAGYSVRDNDFYSEWDDDRARPRPLHRVDARERARGRGADDRMSEPATPEETMVVNAARELRNGQVCLVGVGPPNAATNLARRLHAPDCVLVYESGAIGAKPVRLPLSIGDDDLAETAAGARLGAGDLQLLGRRRAHRRRLPRRRPDRPLRQHQHDGHRALRRSPRCACRAPAARPRSPPPRARSTCCCATPSARSCEELDFVTSVGHRVERPQARRHGLDRQGPDRRHHRPRRAAPEPGGLRARAGRAAPRRRAGGRAARPPGGTCACATRSRRPTRRPARRSTRCASCAPARPSAKQLV